MTSLQKIIVGCLSVLVFFAPLVLSAQGTINKEVQITATVPGSSEEDDGGVSGGGVSSGTNDLFSTTRVVFSGRAYPGGFVTVIQNGHISGVSVVGSDSLFEIELRGVSSGTQIFALYAKDSNGLRSSLQTFPVSIAKNVITTVSGILISPTLTTDKSQVKKGDILTISGQSSPRSTITISVNSEEESFYQVLSDEDGRFLLNLDTEILEQGNYTVKARSKTSQSTSPYSQPIEFIVGSVNILKTSDVSRGDLNGDKRVDLTDLSILAYWYGRPLSDDMKEVERERLNGDGIINLSDLSIAAYYWTG